jgi:hypothetical protein
MCRPQARHDAQEILARIVRKAATMNRAVHPPTTASEIQLIWQ